MPRLNKLTISGFKSIKSLVDFELSSLNVLIGANGAGKSNLVEFFHMLRAMTEEGFQVFVNDRGRGDGFFFQGPKVTPMISAHLEFGYNLYEFDLKPTGDGSLQFAEERVQYTGGAVFSRSSMKIIGKGTRESRVRSLKDKPSPNTGGMGITGYVFGAVSGWIAYHFHDTSLTSPMRRDGSARDFQELRHDASNLAAYLRNMRETSPGHYELIRDTVRLIAPFFDDFILNPASAGAEEKIRLEWRQKGSNFPFQPGHLSDGTLRFICLATALQQPYPPRMIVIDEPELGLHPFAIKLVADLISAASTRTQVVISTQSPMLLRNFEPEQVVVVDRVNGESRFSRLNPEKLGDWLTDYSIDELWQKNVIHGGPVHE